MLLVADIGNINIGLAIFEKDDMLCNFNIKSIDNKSSDEYGILLISLLNNKNINVKDIDGVIIASVVPEVVYSFTSAIIKYFNIEPLIVGPGVKSGVSIHYDNPKEIGADRIATVAGAIKDYGNNLLIIDFSTAISFDYIDDKANYRGGVMVPGISISVNALSKNASMLPNVEIKRCDSVLTNNTVSAMQAGLYFGYLGMVESLINQFKKEIGGSNPVKVVATGGFGKIFKNNSELIDIYDANLAFKGLKNIYYKNKKD